MRNTSQNSHSPHQDLKPGSPKYKARVKPNDFSNPTYTHHKTSQSISRVIRMVYWKPRKGQIS